MERFKLQKGKMVSIFEGGVCLGALHFIIVRRECEGKVSQTVLFDGKYLKIDFVVEGMNFW